MEQSLCELQVEVAAWLITLRIFFHVALTTSGRAGGESVPGL